MLFPSVLPQNISLRLLPSESLRVSDELIDMAEVHQDQIPVDPANQTVKRKRGRPRKDETLGSETPKRNRRPKTNRDTLDPDPFIGQVVSGFLDGKFDAGYMLTVQAGGRGRLLRGLVFKPGYSVPISSDNDVAPNVKMFERSNVSLPSTCAAGQSELTSESKTVVGDLNLCGNLEAASDEVTNYGINPKKVISDRAVKVKAEEGISSSVKTDSSASDPSQKIEEAKVKQAKALDSSAIPDSGKVPQIKSFEFTKIPYPGKVLTGQKDCGSESSTNQTKIKPFAFSKISVSGKALTGPKDSCSESLKSEAKIQQVKLSESPEIWDSGKEISGPKESGPRSSSEISASDKAQQIKSSEVEVSAPKILSQNKPLESSHDQSSSIISDRPTSVGSSDVSAVRRRKENASEK